MNSSYVIYTSLPRTHTHSPSQTQTALLQSHGLQGDCHSPRFTNTFENVFSGDHLKSPFTFHVLAGKFPQFTPPPPGCLSFTATVLAFTPRCPCSFVWVVLANSLVHLCVFLFPWRCVFMMTDNLKTAIILKSQSTGNHDHLGNVTAQIEYSKISERWSFPTEYYTFTETGGDGSTVQFVMIDTVILGGGSEVLHPVTDEIVRELHGNELPGPSDQAKADAQLAWIASTIASSTADYLLVAGHYPVYVTLMID